MHGPAKYERLFRRIDTDGDGHLTMREFKQGLKGLGYKNEKEWTFRIIRRLFAKCDKNKDGLLSIKEFNVYILDLIDNTPDARINQLNLSDDDDDDDDIFYKRKTITDIELFRKVREYTFD